jgi:hypothetical protein
MGFLPEAMVNYLVRLGWSYGDEEIFTLEDLITKFSIESVGRSAGVFNPDKLLWLNAHYIKTGDPERLAELLKPFLPERGVDWTVGPDLVAVVRTLLDRSRTMLEMAIRNQASMNRIASSGFAPPSNDAPMSPAEIQNYAMSANRNLVQHRDTVRYITGCAAAGPVDTTTYILFANDSVHRLQPSPRSLGRMMALAVRADMSSVLLRQRVSTGPAPDLPGPRKWPCDKR